MDKYLKNRSALLEAQASFGLIREICDGLFVNIKGKHVITPDLWGTPPQDIFAPSLNMDFNPFHRAISQCCKILMLQSSSHNQLSYP